MNIINFGSVNIDRVYRVPHFVRPGETISSTSFSVYPGGKGFNQSTAIARAGAKVWHGGAIGSDGLWLKDSLNSDGVNTDFLKVTDTPSGHAIIQVDDNGQNSIIIDGGANASISPVLIDEILNYFGEGDYLLLQNEVSNIPLMMELAHRRKMKIVFNPAPMSEEVRNYPLEKVSLFVLNEIEAMELAEEESVEPERLLRSLSTKFPNAEIVLTLGKKGSVARLLDGRQISIPAKEVKAVDTTAAGDTFIGYLLAGLQKGDSMEKAMIKATCASAICVMRAGAAPSIPRFSEL